jgi:hypothetical protein
MPRIFIVLVFAAAIVAVQTGYAHAGASPRAADPDVIARWIGTRDVGTDAPDAVERWLAGHVEKTAARDGKATLPESQPISDTRNSLDLARNRRRDTAGLAMPVSDNANTLALHRSHSARGEPATRTPDVVQTPISDVESSLLAARARSRGAAGAAPAPVSDNSNSLAMQRASATSAVRHLSPAGGGFAWGAAGIGGAAVFLLLAAAASGLSLAKRHRELAA